MYKIILQKDHETIAILESVARPAFLSNSDAKQILDRLEFDASWDKCGEGYYRLKEQISPLFSNLD